MARACKFPVFSFALYARFAALLTPCEKRSTDGGRLTFLSSMVTHAVASMPRTAKCACVANKVKAQKSLVGIGLICPRVGIGLRQDPLDFGFFLSFLPFLLYGIEEVEWHLL